MWKMIGLRRKSISSSGAVPATLDLLCWILCFILILPVFQSAPPSPSSSCSSSQPQGTGECDDPTRASSSDYTHRIANVARGASAVDVCLIISAAQTMRLHQRWLQIAVPQLEQLLVGMGIGNETEKPNRYCVVQFGGRGEQLRGHFLYVNGNEFFPSTSFVTARRQLKRSGDIADGYEATEFALNNAPFRNDNTVKKVLFVVTNMGRSVLATKANLTKNLLLNMLLEKDVIFDTIVSADFTLQSRITETVIGVSGYNISSVVRPSGGYEFIHSPVTLTSNEGQTVNDYVTLSLAAGSSSWSINHLADEVTDVIRSFVRSFVDAHVLERLRMVEVCQRCLCAAAGGSVTTEGGGMESCETLVCDEHPDQQLCRCLVTRAPSECGVIDPTPVIPSVSSVGPMETPGPLLVEGSLSQFPGGEVEVSFDSDRSKANYQCVLLDQGPQPPTVIPCESPYYLKNLSSGQYELLVIGKRKESLGSLRFKFTIERDNLCDPVIHLSSAPTSNGSVAVTFREECFTVPGSEGTVQFQCSTAGREFTPCSSPFTISPSDITNSGVDFIVVGQDWRDRVHARIQHIPPPPVAGPVMITNITVHPPDPFGRITIQFITTDPSATCRCKANQSIHLCPRRFTADPRVLGEGLLNITISCVDSMGYVDTKDLKLLLQMPPLPPSGPLSCQLSLEGPTERGILIATYSCDRRVITTCQIAKMPPQSCNLPPSGQYEVDVSALEPGPHLFIINFDDGYGKSVMKIYPFSIGTAHRKCCPQIASNSTVAAVADSANLSLSVMAGNCSSQEGFRYTVNWGDGASETGTSTALSDVHTSRTYDTLNSESRNFTIEVSYCNNPVTEQNVCCDSITLTVHL